MVATHNEFQPIYRNIDSLEERDYHESVVFRAFFYQFNRGFEGIKECMDIGKENLDFAAGAKEMGDLDLPSTVSTRIVDSFFCTDYHGYEIGAVRSVMLEIRDS